MLGLAEGLGSGKLLGPELFYCGRLFTAPNGHPAGTIYRGQHELIDNATVQVDREGPALVKLIELSGQGASFIKIVYDDGTFHGGEVPRLRRGLAAQIVGEAHSRGLPVIAHDGVEHCFAFNGPDAVFREAAARGIVFTPTLSIYEIYATAVMPRMMQSVARARDNGVMIATGTDFPSSKYMTAGEGFYRERRCGACREPASLRGGDIREGAFSPQRVRRVLLRGKEVVVDRTVPDERRAGLRRQPIMVFPFGFYETLSGVSAGASLLDFNLFAAGAAIELTAAYSFINCFAAELTVSSPSPIPRTALDFRRSLRKGSQSSCAAATPSDAPT